MIYPTTVGIEEKLMIQNPDNWQHASGEVCFKRLIDLSLPK
jgi:hypothetical protein